LDQYTSLRAENGWMKRPDGIIEQWGVIIYPQNNMGEGKTDVSFPVAFPTECLNASVSSLNSGNHNMFDTLHQINMNSLTKTGFTVYRQWTGSGGTAFKGIYWRAIGH